MANPALFVVVDREGNLKTLNGKLSVYKSQRWAERACKLDGESVVRVSISLSKQPVFIRNQPINPGGDPL